MLKEYLSSKGITTYSLAKSSNVAYSSLNDLVNGKVEIDHCRVSMLRSLCSTLNMSMDELYNICSGNERLVGSSYGNDIRVSVRNKSYYASFEYMKEPIELLLCKVNEDSSYYIDYIAAWRADEYIRNRRMKDFR